MKSSHGTHVVKPNPRQLSEFMKLNYPVLNGHELKLLITA